VRGAASGKPLAAGLAALALSVSLSRGASAYCRSTTCEADLETGIQGAQCEPPQETDCGVPLRWERDCIGFTLQQDASDEIDLKMAKQTLAAAFEIWESVDCGKGSPGIHAVDMGTVECDRVEYEPRAGNANILIFRDRDWEENGYDKLALTTVNYDKETGEIWNADIEVNTAGYDFAQGKNGGDNDLLGVLTHEVGHFLGLAHSPYEDATMYEAAHEGMADLTEDDVSGICTTYPPKSIKEDTCNPIPRHGFSAVCASSQTEGQCGIAAAGRPGMPSETPVLAIATAVGVLLVRRRDKRSPIGSRS